MQTLLKMNTNNISDSERAVLERPYLLIPTKNKNKNGNVIYKKSYHLQRERYFLIDMELSGAIAKTLCFGVGVFLGLKKINN